MLKPSTLLIALIIAIATGTHIWLSTGTLNYDEIGQMTIVQDPGVSRLFMNVWWRNHFIGTAGAHMIYVLGGRSEWVLRIPSTFLFISACVCFCLLAKNYIQPFSVSIVLVLFCFNPAWLSLSATFRGYASYMALFLALLLTCTGLTGTKRAFRIRDYVLVSVLSALLSLTHLFGVFAAAALGIALLTIRPFAERLGRINCPSCVSTGGICILLGVVISSPFYLIFLDSIIWYGDNVSGPMPSLLQAGKALAGLYGALVFDWGRSFIGGPVYAGVIAVLVWRLVQRRATPLDWLSFVVMGMFLFVFLVLRPREMHMRFLLVLLPVTLIVIFSSLNQFSLPRKKLAAVCCGLLILGPNVSALAQIKPSLFPVQQLQVARTKAAPTPRFVLFPNHASGEFVFGYYLTEKEKTSAIEFGRTELGPQDLGRLWEMEQSPDRSHFVFLVYNFHSSQTPVDWKNYLLEHCEPIPGASETAWTYKVPPPKANSPPNWAEKTQSGRNFGGQGR
jgi:hypothetical protein